MDALTKELIYAKVNAARKEERIRCCRMIEMVISAITSDLTYPPSKESVKEILRALVEEMRK